MSTYISMYYNLEGAVDNLWKYMHLDQFENNSKVVNNRLLLVNQSFKNNLLCFPIKPEYYENNPSKKT